ncbi:MAG: hypothetical protein AAF483_25105 [Planctomycetota bacterium]
MQSAVYSNGSALEPLQGIEINVPNVVVAQPVDREMLRIPNAGGKLLRIKVPVALTCTANATPKIGSYSIQLRSPHSSIAVVDMWPKNEFYSSVQGGIAVETTNQKSNSGEASISAGLEPFARAKLSANQQNQFSVKERFEKQPKRQTIASSGIIDRGYGVFFRFSGNSNVELQGTREIAMLVEVPKVWRADLLLVSVEAVTQRTQPFGAKEPYRRDMWLSVYQEGDKMAAAQVQKFYRSEQSLRVLASERTAEVQRKSAPTFFHQVGISMNLVNPRIPSDYLSQVIFGQVNQYFEGDAHRLPIDLRVAILDFWEERKTITDMAFGRKTFLGPSTQNFAHRAQNES